MSDFSVVTRAQRRAWGLGDLSMLAARTPPLYAERLCEELDLRARERVLDVAAGTGTASIAAARRFCEVVASDFVPESLEAARRLAGVEGLELDVRVADAQDLPFADGSFDVVISTFGAMFAPDQERVAAELLRVVRPGGRIGLVAWRPDGVVGAYAAAIGKYLAPPPGVPSPFGWGTARRVRELFGGHGTLRTATRTQPFRYPSVEFAVGFLAEWYGPARGALAVLGEERRAALRDDMAEVWRSADRAGDGTLVADAAYLETVVVKEGRPNG
ncbi:class I SAM-dependent methyltransferase [Actinomadura litoris]|uniref:class I SAM-dependent methyltransferase n=1 Tax=Actinomadura litoris TaxID=2678616 RepID=UPI001FA72893|nr:class I SAM-dependent methyltransferase [Actinomadura litoris]